MSITSPHCKLYFDPLAINSRFPKNLLLGSTNLAKWFTELRETSYSVQFSHSVMADSLWSHGLQHTRLPCPSPPPRTCSNSCPSDRWCHPAVLSSVILLSSCLQSFSALGSFPMSLFIRWPKCWGFSFSIDPSNKYSGLISFRSDWLKLLVGQETLKSLFQYHSSKASILWCSWFNCNIHTWLLEKP